MAALAMLPSAGHRVISRRLLAIELLIALSFILLIPLSFAFDQPSSIDLALTVSFLALPGTLLFACLGERWL